MRKRYAKWLLITLVMAIGIGTFAALSLNNEKHKEESEAQPSSYLTNQRQHDIDMEELKTLTGEYQSEDTGDPESDNYVEDWWHLMITEEFEGKGPYLSVYDNSAGNPGFEGRIMYLKDGIVIVEIDEDLYEGMPADWQPEGEDKYAILDYRKSGDDVVLGYRGNEMLFIKED